MPADTVHLFTDIEGSTRLWESQPERMRAALAAHDALGRDLVAAHQGRLVKTTGDGLHAVFSQPAQALAAACALQQALQQPDLADSAAGPAAEIPPEFPLRLVLRCGLHAGADELRDNDFYGRDVNRAARLMAAAHGGQVLVSERVARSLGAPPWPGLPPEACLLALGAVRLRDLPGPEPVHQLLAPGLRADFPPLRGLAQTPHNLPQTLNRFVGRADALAQVQALLARHRLVTLWGPGGMGKSRLSVELAQRLLEEFPDGVWLAELAPLADPAAVAPAVAAVLGVKESPGQSLIEALVHHVVDRRLLVLLDNCEHVHAAAARLAKQLLQAGPGLRLLATSRELLHVAGEQAFALPPLGLAESGDALQLFAERAALVRPDFALAPDNHATVAEICRRLDGIPLAIELAAARLRAMPLATLAQRLQASFRLLATPDATVPERQRTVQVLIDWSWDLLEPPEQVLLARLSVFAGSFALEAAEAVCGDAPLPADEVLDRLGQLVDKSLVVLDAHSQRYRLLETVRAYAADKLDAAGRPALRGRYAEHFLAQAAEALPRLADSGAQAGLPVLDVAWPHLLEVVATAEPDAQGANTVFAAAALLRNYCLHRGLLTTGLQLMQGALAHPAGQARDLRRARALFNMGHLCNHLGRHADARDALVDCLDIVRSLGDEAREASVLQPLGLALAGLGDEAEARQCYETAIAVAERLQLVDQLLSAQVCLAQWHQANQGWVDAERLYRSAIELARQQGNGQSTAIVELNLGMVLMRLGDQMAARDCACNVLALGHSDASAAQTLGLLDLGAALAADAGQTALAVKAAAAAERLCRGTGLRRERGDERFLDPWRSLLAEWQGGQAGPGEEADPAHAMALLSAWLQADSTPVRTR